MLNDIRSMHDLVGKLVDFAPQPVAPTPPGHPTSAQAAWPTRGRILSVPDHQWAGAILILAPEELRGRIHNGFSSITICDEQDEAPRQWKLDEAPQPTADRLTGGRLQLDDVAADIEGPAVPLQWRGGQWMPADIVDLGGAGFGEIIGRSGAEAAPAVELDLGDPDEPVWKQRTAEPPSTVDTLGKFVGWVRQLVEGPGQFGGTRQTLVVNHDRDVCGAWVPKDWHLPQPLYPGWVAICELSVTDGDPSALLFWWDPKWADPVLLKIDPLLESPYSSHQQPSSDVAMHYAATLGLPEEGYVDDPIVGYTSPLTWGMGATYTSTRLAAMRNAYHELGFQVVVNHTWAP